MRTSSPTVAASRGSCRFYPYHLLHTRGTTGAGHGSLLSSGPLSAACGNLQTNPPRHPERALPRLAPEEQKSPQGRLGKAVPCSQCQAALVPTPRGLCPGDLLLADPARHRD